MYQEQEHEQELAVSQDCAGALTCGSQYINWHTGHNRFLTLKASQTSRDARLSRPSNQITSSRYVGASRRLLLLPDLLKDIRVRHNDAEIHIHRGQKSRLELELPKFYGLFHSIA
jgi:hypothetical protein